MFKKHKAIQNLPAHQHAWVHLKALSTSWFHLCLLIVYTLWFIFFFILIFNDRIHLWALIVNLIVILSFFPFQMVTPKKRLAEAFLKLNIRPSHCGYCEYDLRATEGDSCPECGTRLVAKDKTEK